MVNNNKKKFSYMLYFQLEKIFRTHTKGHGFPAIRFYFN